ncbi:hypothetical protein C9J01_04250 [Photobacterium rosenbergii]|uniref:N-acetyltransferase domain-containing protein n=1 Tax=Photobacterium rosenbergii TaxID=294936 RepID=A0A2T3NL63_9GAMM|nr:GNAT family N-acetyltransferase [Photobacterium rosenbergii]PSW16219.1 hypothetical protein C9J01_04250 [Photobacterium rosenbergii]
MENKIIEVRQLGCGDEHLALAAIKKLLPGKEGEALTSTVEHLKGFLSCTSNVLILAVHDDEPIGFLSAYIMPKLERAEYMAYFYEIEVSPSYRRKGVATRMVSFLKSELKGQGVSSLWVGTDVDNKAALSLYESTGAIREPELIHEFWYEDI